MSSVVHDPRDEGAPDDPVVAATAALERILTQDTSSWPGAARAARVSALASVAERAEAALALAVAGWAPTREWEADGARSPIDWLVGQTGADRRSAIRLTRTGRHLARHEETARHLAAGDLPASRAHALAAAARGGRGRLYERDEEVLLGAAESLPEHDFEQAVARWRALADDELADGDAEHNHRHRRLHLTETGRGSWVLNGSFDSDGAVVNRAIELAGPPDPVDIPGGPRTAAQRRADALVDICSRFLATQGGSDESGGPAAAVDVLVDARVLAASSDDGFDLQWRADVIDTSTVLPRSTLQQWLCDSWVGRIVMRGRSEVLDLGRQTRTFTRAQRRAMIARDGDRCVWPKCPIPAAWCDAHHGDGWDAGGSTDLDNGHLLCRRHHGRIHRDGWTLTREPSGGFAAAPPRRC